jgi:hypothetical protein
MGWTPHFPGKNLVPCPVQGPAPPCSLDNPPRSTHSQTHVLLARFICYLQTYVLFAHALFVGLLTPLAHAVDDLFAAFARRTATYLAHDEYLRSFES